MTRTNLNGNYPWRQTKNQKHMKEQKQTPKARGNQETKGMSQHLSPTREGGKATGKGIRLAREAQTICQPGTVMGTASKWGRSRASGAQQVDGQTQGCSGAARPESKPPVIPDTVDQATSQAAAATAAEAKRQLAEDRMNHAMLCGGLARATGRVCSASEP